MSGILCVHQASGIPQDLARYQSALRRLAHRGSNREGSELRPDEFLGVRQSPEGREGPGQPLIGADGQVIVGFDGHLHNRGELVHELKAKGFRADCSTDPAIALALYIAFGRRGLERLRGVWVVALWDARSRRLLVGRDPLGVRPLYYYQIGRAHV